MPVGALTELAYSAPVERAEVPALFIFSDADKVVRPERTRDIVCGEQRQVPRERVAARGGGVLAHVLERCNAIPRVDVVICATVEGPEGLPVARIAEESGAAVDMEFAVEREARLDPEDGRLPAVCSHQSGDMFPVGLTEVRCATTDSGGLSATGRFRNSAQRRLNGSSSSTGKRRRWLVRM